MNQHKHEDRYKKHHGFSVEDRWVALLGGGGFLILLLLVLILAWIGLGPDARKDSDSYQKSTTRKRNPRPRRRRLPYQEEEGTTEDFPYGPAEKTTEKEEEPLTEEDFYDALKEMGKKIQDAGLPYNGNAGHKTYEGAQDFNCALFVSWTLQEMKLIPSGKTFWFDHKGHGGGFKYMKKHKEIFEIYHPNCPIATSAMVKPGDICGMKINGYAPHTAVFAGRDHKGRMVWYSAGRTDFRKMAKKGFQPVRFKYYEQGDDILYTIVRIKFDKIKEENDM